MEERKEAEFRKRKDNEGQRTLGQRDYPMRQYLTAASTLSAILRSLVFF